MKDLRRRDFLKVAGLAAGAAIPPRESVLLSMVNDTQQAKSVAVREYGLLECVDSKLLSALAKSRAGILNCTVNGQTHCADAGRSGALTMS